MNHTPPLSSFNKFNVLLVDEIHNSIPTEDLLRKDVPSDCPTRPTRCPRWEKRLPQKLTIAGSDSNPDPHSLIIPIEIKTTDTTSQLNVHALIDSGATGTFIDKEFV